jgi:hypothetical protein
VLAAQGPRACHQTKAARQLVNQKTCWDCPDYINRENSEEKGKYKNMT